MANSIALFKTFVPMLDEVYKAASKTGILDGAPEVARAGANANEMIIPMLDMNGLADYSRNDGYVNGDVTMTNQTVACNYDRGRMFTVDTLDDAETAGLAFGRLASEFIRTKVVPELDAFRLAQYAGHAGILRANGALAAGDGVINALRAGTNAMDEDEVPEEDRILFITPTLYGMVQDLDTTKSRAVMERFGSVIQVPKGRMYSAIVLADGKTEGQEEGGFSKAEGATDINFMIVHRAAVIQYQKHIAPKVITPDQNQNGDAWKFGYRNVGIAKLYRNKLSGVYCHTVAKVTA